MSPSRNNSAQSASYVMILGSLLTILPNLPVINEYLPIVSFETLFIKGGTNFLGSYFSLGNYQGSIQAVKGWTLLGLDGQVLWLIFVAIGVAGIAVGFILKSDSLIKMLGLIGGALEVILSVLIFIGDSQDATNYGLSNIANTGSISIGLGFWLILVGSIIFLASGLMLLKK